ncbi:multiple sugar transport system permease protein [Actinopolymorpha cephalotaxi]|uniref:ABC-type glycerol-3-phosphate transport system permease component n=1 Tax=Actinopolymorpha cephalotaxi TaxID=504797 RepID=A0A1I3BBQ0_9ACTN|nr:carbohydrate ABC transporter permease [Actinopolymorpha cephalotaxi]NYH86773.1 ABC-type glycerol-3-phosphate transport system permease component [Actinopolymorpha cephalotaxi]SFH59723.1 multiple sugar transport system permease protein [Actinopolymorpha cephalotaxi]
MSVTDVSTHTTPRADRPHPNSPGSAGGRGRAARRALLYLGLAIVLLGSVLPMVWAVSGSFKSIDEIFAIPPHLIPKHATFANYVTVFTDISLPKWLWTSLWTALVSTTISVIFSTMGGYAFAKFRFRGSQILFDIMFSSMMIPVTVLVIPLFVQIAGMGLGNSYVALILPWLAPAFGIFMMRQFIVQAVPTQMIEAARIDGAGELSIFFRIVLPVLRPALGALAVWLFLTSYNNFMWPLIVIADANKYTLPLGLNSLTSAYTADYGVILAGSVIAAIPTVALFIALRKQLISGLTLGAVKG